MVVSYLVSENKITISCEECKTISVEFINSHLSVIPLTHSTWARKHSGGIVLLVSLHSAASS